MLSKIALPAFSFPHLPDNSQLQFLRQQAKKLLTYYSKQDQSQHLHSLLQAKIQIEKAMVQNQTRPQTKGRGGNNSAENIKKAFLAILKRKIRPSLFTQIEDRLITPYAIKSQKENLVIFFLFLYILEDEQKVAKQLILQLEGEMKRKIEKYIRNSEERMQSEDWRRDFHQKNIKEFRKFLTLNLDFGTEINFEEICSQIQPFYLRKKQECAKAEQKIKRVILQHSCLANRFNRNINSDSTTNTLVISNNSSFQTIPIDPIKEQDFNSPSTD